MMHLAISSILINFAKKRINDLNQLITSMDNEEFLNKPVLDALYQHVIKNIDYLSYHNSNQIPFWNSTIEMCRRIEKELMAVNSVIKEVTSNTNFYNGSIRYSHITLSKVYILLYFRHHDEKVFQDGVFNLLIPVMGIYGKTHLNNINSKIDFVISLTKIYSSYEEEQRQKRQKVMFRLEQLSRAELDKLFQEFNEEKLFREFFEFYEDNWKREDLILDYAETWHNAKIIVRTLAALSHPETYISRIMLQLDSDSGFPHFFGTQYIIICSYVMMRSVKSNHFSAAIKRIESLSLKETDYHIIKEQIESVKKWIDAELPFDEYDYTTSEDTEAEMDDKQAGLSKEVEQKIETLMSEIQKKDEKITQMKSDLAAKDKKIEELQNSIVTAVEQSEENLYKDVVLEAAIELGIDERIIFFTSVLKWDITNNELNQSQLAVFICHMTGDDKAEKRETIRPRINKIVKMQREKKFTDAIIQAAKNLIAYLNNCCKKDVNGEEANLTNAISDIIDDIEKTYGV